ncbi:beta strand repeat-containing protein [Noviherbaspirillum galbum]|uniref:S-layer family protein n=1 Tax=Noviherbaspirillum galbum TaxID=2709383 RepID=A0A6B3SJB9_9BURK|nr:DUF4214 domain-containing protein [Noviherbaspirillum galbum]NEX60897.1 S-layer family protein [Noviherbaspirillum galbum]
MATMNDTVQQMYVAFFNRPADALGLAFWVSKLQGGLSVSSMAASFAASDEYKALYAGKDAATTVAILYTNLFGRTAAPTEVTFWGLRLLQGLETVDGIALKLTNSAQGTDAATITNKIAASTAFTTGLDSTAKITGYTGLQANLAARAWLAGVTDAASLAGATAADALNAAINTAVNVGSGSNSATFNLTPGVDNATANQFYASETQFNVDGKGPTINTGDVLTGQSGRTDNTLTITDLTPSVANGNIPAGVKLQNIQNVILNTSNNTAASGFSVVPYSDVVNVQVNTNGTGGDVVVASNGGTTNPTKQSVVVNHQSYTGGTVQVIGGFDVNVTQNANAAITIGQQAAGTVPQPNNVPTGPVTVTQNSTAGGAVNVVGGSKVTVTTTGASFTGAINIGNVSASGNSLAGALSNSTGAIVVNNAGTTSTTNVSGGSTVNVTAAGGVVNVGDAGAVIASNMPTGAVTVNDTAPVAYDNLNIANNVNHNATARGVNVYGGTDVNVTTNAGGVVIGTNTLTATLPTGNITITSTANDQQAAAKANAAITAFGGKNVTVNAADVDVTLGGTTGYNPTGVIAVKETAASTNRDVATGNVHTVTINGGNGVTVNAQGQNVSVGAAQGTGGAQVVTQSGVMTGAGMGGANGTVEVDGGSTVSVTTTGGAVTVGKGSAAGAAFNATGAVTVTNTFGAGNAGNDATTVFGGAAVNVSYNNANKGAVLVGDTASYDANTMLNATGTGLKAAFAIPTGDVTISSKQTNGTTNTFGTGAVKVVTNGAANVSITGDAPAYVVDAQSILATGGANANKAIGTSTLANVKFDGVRTAGAIAIQSDALSNLTVTTNTVAGNSFNITNNTAGHTLNITTGGNTAGITVQDNVATTINLADNGTASTGATTLTAAKATTLNVNTTAAATVAAAGASALTKIVLTNKGTVALGSVAALSSLAMIDATASTGAVSVAINTAVTSFNGVGGTGNQTVTINNNSTVQANGTTFNTIFGGSGSNTLVANYVAAANDTALGNNARIKGFSTLSLGTAASSSTGHAAYQAGVTAQAQVSTVTINGGNGVATQTYTVQLNAGATYTFTSAGGETPAQIAANLAGGLLAQGNSGYTVGYTAGNNTFTVTGPAAGTAFTVTVGGTAATAPTQAVTTTGATSVTGDNFYDATGFTALTVGQTAGDVTFKNAGAGSTLTLTDGQNAASTNLVNYLLTNSAGTNDTLDLTVNATAARAHATKGTINATVLTTGIENLKVTSTGTLVDALGNRVVNTVTIGDTAAKSVTVSGAQDVTLTLKTDANATLAGGASNVTTLDASASTGKVDLTGVALKDNTAHTITGGNGQLVAKGGTHVADVDTVTSGAGGIDFSIGTAGKWVAVAGAGNNGAYAAGSTTINLSASAGATDTLKFVDGAVSTFNGTKGGITGFVTGVSKADALNFQRTAGVAQTKSILANVATPTVVSSLASAQNSALSIDKTGALFTALGNLTYTISNGVITFGATAGHQIADFTSGQLVSAAEIIVNDAAAGDMIAAFSYNGNSYVVASDQNRLLSQNGGAAGAHTNGDTLVNLIGVGTVTGFGSTGAAGTIVANVANIAPTIGQVANTGNATAQVYNDAGFAVEQLGVGGGHIAAYNTTNAASLSGLQSYTFNNLAASAVLNIGATGTDNHHIGDVTVNQAAAAGQNSLTVNLNAAATKSFIDKLTVNGDAVLVLNGASGGTSEVVSLVDGTNTLSSVTISGANSVAVDSITSSSLAGVTVTNTATTTLAGATAVIAKDAFTVTATTANQGTIVIGNWTVPASPTAGLTGNANVITIGSLANQNNNANKIFASGTNDVITIVGAGGNSITANGAGTKIDVGVDTTTYGGVQTVGNVGANTISALGANEIVTFHGTANGASTVALGPNGTVTFSTTTGANSQTITLAGDVAGAATSGSYSFTTLNNVVTGTGDKIVLQTAGAEALAGGTFAASLVNVASATTLAQALDLAIAQAAISQDTNPNSATYAKIAANTGVINWFQFQGNTYVVEAVNATGAAAANPALDANDMIVKITGLVDLGAAALAGHTITL